MSTGKLKTRLRGSRGFSVLEIAIAVVIVLVMVLLMALSFEQAHLRSNTARVKNDFSNLATAIAAYFVDYSEYPAMATGAEGANARYDPGSGAYQICTFRLRNYGKGGATQTMLKTLTTPISYISEYYRDPFASSRGSTYGYRQYRQSWVLISYGPDQDENTTMSDHYNTVADAELTSGGFDLNFEPSYRVKYAESLNLNIAAIGVKGTALHYDPTNGAFSEGDIARIGGGVLLYDPTNGTTGPPGARLRIKN